VRSVIPLQRASLYAWRRLLTASRCVRRDGQTIPWRDRSCQQIFPLSEPSRKPLWRLAILSVCVQRMLGMRSARMAFLSAEACRADVAPI
jgi:hypothetical protein